LTGGVASRIEWGGKTGKKWVPRTGQQGDKGKPQRADSIDGHGRTSGWRKRGGGAKVKKKKKGGKEISRHSVPGEGVAISVVCRKRHKKRNKRVGVQRYTTRGKANEEQRRRENLGPPEQKEEGRRHNDNAVQHHVPSGVKICVKS